MLEIKDLSVNVEDTNIIDKLNLDFQLGKNYALLWKNGSGKSSLFFSIMWHPAYSIEGWDILLDGKSIKAMKVEERSKNWIFLAFQNIPEIPGVKMFDFLRNIYNAALPEGSDPVRFIPFKKIIQPFLDDLGLEKKFLFRDLNVGFSGGEKRKMEILQLKLLKPKYILLDEVDSGLDINSLRMLWEMLKEINSEDNSFIITSHYFDIYNYLDIEQVYILEKGKLKNKWWKDIIKSIKKEGF